MRVISKADDSCSVSRASRTEPPGRPRIQARARALAKWSVWIVACASAGLPSAEGAAEPASDSEYRIAIVGNWQAEGSSARADLIVSGEFDVDTNGQVAGKATHINKVTGECVVYEERLPQRIDGWVEEDRIHLRFHKLSDVRPVIDEVNKNDASCMLKGLQELGTLLALVGKNVAQQAGDERTATAELPGGLQIPGEVTYPLLEPGQKEDLLIGNLVYSISRRN